MKFYESIADYYEFIFDPQDSAEIIDGLYLGSRASRVIDVGCATGKLAAGLAKLKHDVIGIDLDEKMIGIARERYMRKSLALDFKAADMLEVSKIFGSGAFDAAVCVGNTIVHLNGAGVINDFFRSARLTLRPGGVFIGQILNYARIMSEKIDSLPLIDNDNVRFERYYDLDAAKHGGRIVFKTRLTVKESGAVIYNEALLYPASKDEIAGALSSAGFSAIEFYSDIDRTPFSAENSFSLAFRAAA